MVRLVLILAPAALLLAACGATPADPGTGQVVDPGPSRPITPEDAATRTGRVIFECDTHLRAWIGAMGKPRSLENQEDIAFLAMALGRVVVKDREVLVKEAVSGSPRNRGIASAALGFSADPEVLPMLSNNALDDDPFVASKALLGLGVMASTDTPASLYYQAFRREDRTEEMTRNLAFAMYQIAEVSRSDTEGRMAPVLIQLLEDPDHAVRWQAAMSLGLIRATLGIPTLTDLLAGDNADEVRSAAAWALGMIGSTGSTRPLMIALDDPDPICAGAARAALKRIHGRDLGPDPASWESVARP